MVLNEIEVNLHDSYVLQNGRIVSEINGNLPLNIVPRLRGGKGGFGSMLRAIGAQIEKTTNREACRDLSGRRLRDINEEKRLKTWIDSQQTRDQEAADRKQRKLERLCEKPKHEFRDEKYSKERTDLPERLEDAVEQGLQEVASSSGVKRKNAEDGEFTKKKRKKAALWIEEGLSEDSDISTSDEEETKQLKHNV